MASVFHNRLTQSNIPANIDLSAISTGLGQHIATVTAPSSVATVRALQVGPPTVIVEQNITFAPQFLDAADGDRWLRQKSGEIMGIIAEGAQRSSEFAKTLRGSRR